MKITIIISFVFLQLCRIALCQDTTVNFHLSGKIVGRDTGWLVLRYLDNLEKLIRDTVYLNKGRFEFNGKINQPTYVSIIGYRKIVDFQEANNVGIYLEHGNQTISLVENDYENAKMEGSRSQKEWDVLDTEIDSIKRKYSKISNEYLIAKTEYLKNKNDRNLKIADSLFEQLKPSNREIDNIVISFISRVPDSYVSAYMLYHLIRPLPIDSAEYLYNGLSERAKKSRYGQWDLSELIKKQKSAIGVNAPNFIREDLHGKELALASFKGKSFVLLDFWASWCAPCRAFNPHLKKIFNKYHADGLEIIGISCDTDKSLWKKAIKTDATEFWYHVLENKTNNITNIKETVESLRSKFNVLPIPVQILIDKNGNIIGRFSGENNTRGISLDEKLAEVFK